MKNVNEGDVPTKTSAKAIESMSNVHEKALEILNTGNSVEYIMTEFSKTHIGDKELGEFLLATVGCTLCTNTKGLNPDFSGGSGKGKSNACKAMFRLLPSKYAKKGLFSNKAYFYMGLKEGTVLFIDDVEKLNPDLERLIKISSSDYQSGVPHSYVDFNADVKLGEKSLPARTCWWLTSKDSTFDAQILNRFLKLEVDETHGQDLAVKDAQIREAVTGESPEIDTFETLVCREMISILKEMGPVSVKVVYAEHIQWNAYKNRRNLSMFLDLIKSYAALHQFQRPKDEEGKIVATLEDFYIAARLWVKVDGVQTTGLKDNERRILDSIRKAGELGISFTNIVKSTGINPGTVSLLLKGVNDFGNLKGGLLNRINGLYSEMNGRSTIYYMNTDFDLDTLESGVLLTDPAMAQKLIDEAIGRDACSHLQPLAEPCKSELLS